MGRISRQWRRRLADAAWPRPGFAADGGELGGFQVLAASAAGQKHLHEASQRQDAYYFASLGDGVVLAVADGVSARPLAAIGAEVAVFAAVRSYLVATWSGTEGGRDPVAARLAQAVDLAAEAVFGAAAEMKLAPEDLSTTVLLADLRRDRTGRITVTTAGIGNSSAMIIPAGLPPVVIAGPREGGSPKEYHRFLPGVPGRARIERASHPGEAVVVLATDGFADDLHDSPVLRDWLHDRLGSAVTPVEFAHVLSYRRQGTSDDLTVLAARALPL